MDPKLLTAAALAVALSVSAAPAAAQQMDGSGTPHFRSPGVVRDFDRCRDFRHERDDRRMRRDGRFFCDGFFDGFAYADGEWALYNNRSWEPDSYNDWWHDRPDRAFPRWVREQHMKGSCDPDRMWWSGTGWHC